MQAFPMGKQKARRQRQLRQQQSLLHTKKKKSKRSRVGCRSVVSYRGPRCAGPVWRSPSTERGLQSSGLDCAPLEEF